MSYHIHVYYSAMSKCFTTITSWLSSQVPLSRALTLSSTNSCIKLVSAGCWLMSNNKWTIYRGIKCIIMTEMHALHMHDLTDCLKYASIAFGILSYTVTVKIVMLSCKKCHMTTITTVMSFLHFYLHYLIVIK